MSNDFEIKGIFPTPVYSTYRDSELDSTEKKEIEDIIKEGMPKGPDWKGRTRLSINTYIFNTKLKKIKEFCEQHIKVYVEKIINPKEELDFYITQSWLNITRSGEIHQKHNHQNNLFGGVFYVSTVEEDAIRLFDPIGILKNRIKIEPIEYNLWNSDTWWFPVHDNELILFPSWMEHGVELNEKATTDRISIAFNVFAKGIFGTKDNINDVMMGSNLIIP